MWYDYFMKIVKFFDLLEDRVRAWLSKRPILYALVAGVGAVFFFRGIWIIADDADLGGWFTLFISLVILLLTGAFVSNFVNDKVIISGLKKEKKLVEKTEEEVRSELVTLSEIKNELSEIRKEISEIKNPRT